MNTFTPAEPFPPGEYLQDELEVRGWTQEDLQEITGISRRQIINILQGKSAITPDSAQAIAAAFGQAPVTWMNLQVAFELATAARETRDVERRARLFHKLPIRELCRRGWLPDTKDVGRLEEAACRFLLIDHLDEPAGLRVAARKTDYRFTNSSQLAWYYRVRQLGEIAQARQYRDDCWTDGLQELRGLYANPEDARKVPSALADMGIRLVFVKHLSKTKIDGVALWLDENTPVIGLSLRFDRIDNFWFSLLHELIHVRHKDASPVDEDLGVDSSEAVAEIERRANQEAANCLVAPEKLESFVRKCGTSISEASVVEFSRSQGVHPAIVVGQLQHQGLLKYWQFSKLRAKVGAFVLGQALSDGCGASIAVD